MAAPVCRFAASSAPKLRGIEGPERDSTQDWVVPRGTVPLVSELEARIDEALVIARVSEEGVREVGEIALDAAQQARRAAEAAEASARAAAAVRDANVAGPAGPVTAGDPPPLPVAKASSGAAPPTAPPPGRDVELETSVTEPDSSSEEEPAPKPPVHFEDRFRRFSERADRLSGRLRRLGAHPSHPASPSAAAVRRRGDG